MSLQGCHVSGKCQGIFGYLTHVREFCHDIIFRLILPSYDKGFTWVVFM